MPGDISPRHVPLHADAVYYTEVISYIGIIATDINDVTSDCVNAQLSSERNQLSRFCTIILGNDTAHMK